MNQKPKFRHKPSSGYCGLTIVLSNPSRFDKNKLIEGVASWYFEEKCLSPISRNSCDIRLPEDDSPILDNTKCILVLGAKAHAKFSSQQTSLDENRGSPYFWNNIPVIASFTPQDSMDMRNFESRYHESEEEFDSDEIDAGEAFESKGRGRTDRANYRFWLKKDVKKALEIIFNDGKLPKLYDTQPTYHVWPEPDLVCAKLDSINNEYLYFDCETDLINHNLIRCISFNHTTDYSNIFTVPWLDITYKAAYGKEDQIRIYWSLYNAVRRNILVAHNGSNFDYIILGDSYKIPINRVFDTMIAQHRIYPTIEKSLGHCVSLYTFEEYHKNQGTHIYRTSSQAEQLYLYCGKDIFTMYLVHLAQLERMSKDPGLKASIELAMECIEPYELMGLMGMNFDENLRQKQIHIGDRKMENYMGMIQMLTGSGTSPLISNKTCTEYFHSQLGYKVVARTPANRASLKAENLYKLQLDHDNPVIKLLIAYRETQKATSTLKFKVWKEKENINIT